MSFHSDRLTGPDAHGHRYDMAGICVHCLCHEISHESEAECVGSVPDALEEARLAVEYRDNVCAEMIKLCESYGAPKGECLAAGIIWLGERAKCGATA